MKCRVSTLWFGLIRNHYALKKSHKPNHKKPTKTKKQPPKKAPKPPTKQLFNAHERVDCVKLNIPLSIY